MTPGLVLTILLGAAAAYVLGGALRDVYRNGLFGGATFTALPDDLESPARPAAVSHGAPLVRVPNTALDEGGRACEREAAMQAPASGISRPAH